MVTLTVPASPLVGTVALSAAVTDTIAVAKVEFSVNTTLVGTATTSPFTVDLGYHRVAKQPGHDRGQGLGLERQRWLVGRQRSDHHQLTPRRRPGGSRGVVRRGPRALVSPGLAHRD